MIYQQVTLHVVPENFEEFKKIFGDEVLPLRQKYTTLGGQWQTIIGTKRPVEITTLWVYDDMAHLDRVRKSWSKDEEAKKAVAKIRPFILDLSGKVLTPLPRSPLQ